MPSPSNNARKLGVPAADREPKLLEDTEFPLNTPSTPTWKKYLPTSRAGRDRLNAFLSNAARQLRKAASHEKNNETSPGAKRTLSTSWSSFRRKWQVSRKLRVILVVALLLLIMLITLLSTLLTLLPCARGCPATAPASSNNTRIGTVVDLSYGTYEGIALANGVTQWLGMRYVGSVAGANRFSAPAPPDSFSGIQAANQTIPGCAGINPGKNVPPEDCPSLDLYVPSNITASSKLPVFLFIQGGGNEAANAHFNCSGLVLASGGNMIAATITYRTGAYGFLASKELQANASLNTGYKDQRAAIEWIHTHISAFGGDPNALTIAGQSAGGGAIVAQLTAYGGNGSSLFRAAILQSPSTAPVRSVADMQYQYDNIVARLNCTGAADTLNCLRAVPHDTFIKQVTLSPYPDAAGGNPVYAWNPVVDGVFLQQPPIEAFEAGNFAKVPMLLGSVADEGTIFSPHDITNANQAWRFMRDNYPNLNSSMQVQYNSFYNLSTPLPAPYWNKTAVAYGETRYVCPGLQMASIAVAAGQKAWVYRYDVLDPSAGKAGQGVPHGSDLSAVFGPQYVAGGISSDEAGQSNAEVVPVVQNYFSSFVMTGDPNVLGGEWPAWNETSVRLRFATNNTAPEVVDQQQQERCQYLASIAVALEM